MNAIAKVSEPAGRLLPAVDVLALRAEARADLWWRWMIYCMPDAVDDLQTYAEQSGLVEQLGQDRVQAIIAAPFARYWAQADAAQERGEVRTRADNQHVQDQNKPRVSDIGLTRKDIHEARIIRDAERADPGLVRRTYCTPRSTANAFFHVAQNGSTEHLARWLKDHPLDAPHLLKIWKAKCTAPST